MNALAKAAMRTLEELGHASAEGAEHGNSAAGAILAHEQGAPRERAEAAILEARRAFAAEPSDADAFDELAEQVINGNLSHAAARIRHDGAAAIRLALRLEEVEPGLAARLARIIDEG